jgi:beta-mannosidase
MKTIDLNKNWQVGDEDLSLKGMKGVSVLKDRDNWYNTDLPCDVRQPLIRNGIIKEPLEKLNCYESEWVEERSWWFKKTFLLTPDQADSTCPVDLILDYVDVYGDIFLNGEYLGCHKSVHYPFKQEIRRFLHRGENTLLVRVTTGLERVSDQPQVKEVCTEVRANRGDRGDYRRVLLRKPQYAFGWDWGPRVATCGLGEARLEFHAPLEIGDLKIYTSSLEDDKAVLNLEFEVIHHDILSTREGQVQISVTDPLRQTVYQDKSDLFLRAGVNPFRRKITLNKPSLWWPRGYGEQPLYKITMQTGDSRATETFAIRTLRLNQDKIDSKPGERRFVFEINGVDIFARGANWIPADSLFQRVDDKKYRTLIEEAAEMNFTMLRVWGGGLYEKDFFYDKCDEMGILVWQDFMFGCAHYPDRNEEFRELVTKELTYQINRLKNHASLVLWCGNNENQWIFENTSRREEDGFLGGEWIYDNLAPRLTHLLSDHIPYWNSSPFGGDLPNSSQAGDCHYWHQCMMNPEMEKRITPEEYDRTEHKFISEYGYVGPCAKETIETYFAGEPIDRTGEIWSHHNNTFEKDTVAAGIKKHYCDPENLSLDDYLLYAGLVQGLMYNYSLESFRFKEFCGGGLYWMFNDTWGETGWTVIDYYLNRKISFPYVRRAFEPQKLIMRLKDDLVHVMLCHDGADDFEADLEYGSVSFDGSSLNTEILSVKVGARSQKQVLSFPKPDGVAAERVVFCRLKGSETIPALLREVPFRSLRLTKPQLGLSEEERTKESVTLKISSDKFAHAVHFGLSPVFLLSDEYFDLLPGESRTISIEIKEGREVSLPSLDELIMNCRSVF